MDAFDLLLLIYCFFAALFTIYSIFGLVRGEMVTTLGGVIVGSGGLIHGIIMLVRRKGLSDVFPATKFEEWRSGIEPEDVTTPFHNCDECPAAAECKAVSEDECRGEFLAWANSESEYFVM